MLKYDCTYLYNILMCVGCCNPEPSDSRRLAMKEHSHVTSVLSVYLKSISGAVCWTI